MRARTGADQRRVIISAIVPVVLLALAATGEAADTGITMQTTLSDSYAGTVSLSEPIIRRLQNSANTADRREVGEALKQLRDGDVLVLSVHSNPSVLAVGDETVRWGNFWQEFGITDPPELAAVIVAGCMSHEYEVGGETVYHHITQEQVDFLRRRMNTKALMVPAGEVNPFVARSDVNQLLKIMSEGRKLGEIKAPNWHINVDPSIGKDATLADLRGSSDSDLCARYGVAEGSADCQQIKKLCDSAGNCDQQGNPLLERAKSGGPWKIRKPD